MSLKKETKLEAGFNMSSMTDLIFLLLLFFILASTMSSPNDIKINLPQSGSKTATKRPMAKVSIDDQGTYYLAIGTQPAQVVELEELEPRLLQVIEADTSTCISLHADQTIQYDKVVRVLDIANRNKLKLVIATRTEQ